MAAGTSLFELTEHFSERHLGPSPQEQKAMLDAVGCQSLDALTDQVIPEAIRTSKALSIGQPRTENAILNEAKRLAHENQVHKSYLGMGYYGTFTPAVIQRNIIENPGWYTSYTPYQAEISQGRLEALLNFQTMVCDLTALPVANASLLDEATAAAEAFNIAFASHRSKRRRFFVSEQVHPQTKHVIRGRAQARGWEIVEGSADDIFKADPEAFAAVLLQYPHTDGRCQAYDTLIKDAHQHGIIVVVATDLLSLMLLKAPGEMGADLAVGSAQRFGVPMGFGGPHAAFMACTEKLKRLLPGRIVGVSKDRNGEVGLRLALQTREQHIRRERATSNICTAQALLAIVASMYAVYHGPKGLLRIADRVRTLCDVLKRGLEGCGYQVGSADHPEAFFDTLRIQVESASLLRDAGHSVGINLRVLSPTQVSISLDETTTLSDVADIVALFASEAGVGGQDVFELASTPSAELPKELRRVSEVLSHPVFNQHHSETAMLRYMRRLEEKDLALNRAMIPLGSCTMKLNGTTELMTLGIGGFSDLHPFAPLNQAGGYLVLFDELSAMIRDMTGLDAVSLQPNAGSQGEYAGLMAIRDYHQASGQSERDICLIPASAHGTNPASAVMAGMRVVVVRCDDCGNVDIEDLRAKADEHRERLGAMMITYPSTHGVFETSIKELCSIVHEAGGQVYLDGANFAAMVGLVKPSELGVDVCHLNLHKTFAIPHGGGGPGVGPIAAAEHLSPYLPGHPLEKGMTLDAADDSMKQSPAVAAAPWGSAWILPISWSYMKLMGGAGLKQASQVAILNANYMAKRLEPHYNILFTGEGGWVAHEFIIDIRPFQAELGITVDDIAKRLIDYGFHAPTMSWPVPGTLMIEPTESENKDEIDRFCDAMIAIAQEIECIRSGEWPRDDNPLVNAPHPMVDLISDSWNRPYSKQKAVFALPWVRTHKIWPSVARIDNAYGDRNLMCTCPPLSSFVDSNESE